MFLEQATNLFCMWHTKCVVLIIFYLRIYQVVLNNRVGYITILIILENRMRAYSSASKLSARYCSCLFSIPNTVMFFQWLKRRFLLLFNVARSAFHFGCDFMCQTPICLRCIPFNLLDWYILHPDSAMPHSPSCVLLSLIPSGFLETIKTDVLIMI